MKYECPSCNIEWKDEKEPKELLCHPLCHFCSLPHTQKELLNWQMNHLEVINPDNFKKLLSHFFRYVELELTTIKEKIHGNVSQSGENNGED